MSDSTIVSIPVNSSTPEIIVEQTSGGLETPHLTSNNESSDLASVTIRTSTVHEKIDAVTSLIKEKLKPGLDKSLQTEIAKLLSLIPELAKPQHQQLIPLAEIAAVALLSETPNVILAKEIRENIHGHVHPAPFTTMFRMFRGSSSPPTRVILGLGALLYFALPFLTFFLRREFMPEKVLGIDSSLLQLVAIGGALGSIVSIMVRIQDFALLKDADHSVLFFTGFFKPIIGSSFALFVFAILSSGLIPVTIDPAKATYFFAALAFVSGFSERFAKDVASKAEQVVVAVRPPND